LWPTFTNVPNEFLESYFPLRIEVYETVPDTGGPGFYRGGNALRIAYRFLEPGEISLHDDRWLTYPWGVNGGLPGGRSSKVLERRDGTVEHLAAKCDRIKVDEGDRLNFITWGGGGWGDPLTRDADLVALDVRRGLVTAEGAQRYGVIVDDTLSVDRGATEALRTKMANERDDIQIFDKGGTIDELKARCLEETGFEPPEAPRFDIRGASRAAE
jgi:N-methylhydantoinase B